MSKEKKVAVNFAVAAAIGLTVYLAGQLLLALMVVKGWVAETSAGPAQILLGGAGTFLSGLWASKKVPVGPLTAALAVAGIMVMTLVAVGMLCYEELASVSHLIVRLGIMTVGALLGGLAGATGIGSSRKKQPRRKGKRKF